MDAIVADGLTKYFGEFLAVDQVGFRVRQGEIFGFLGPNGAGKTTTIKMIAGLLQPDRGGIFINGESLAAQPLRCKQQTGYVPDRPWLYEKLTGMEYLQFIASLYSLAPARFNTAAPHFLKLFDLLDWQDHLIESYSHGMRQKLMIIGALLHDPALWIIPAWILWYMICSLTISQVVRKALNIGGI